ncbi:MAG: hypothetical protein ABL958_10175, partial [Bdellovibrionia bacterium]
MNPLELINVPEEKRDQKWELEFLSQISTQNLRLIFPDVKQGPDGCPYLYAELTQAGSEPFVKIADWLSTRGVGLVVNPHKDIPDYIFTYGMLWYYRESGKFIGAPKGEDNGRLILEQGTAVLAGPPSDEFYPPYARGILRDFFKAQKIEGVKILVISKDRLHYDICVSLESLGDPPESEHEGIAELVGWFLPPH